MSAVLFKKKQLTPIKRVCFRLKETREQCGVSLDELARKTKICKKYLQALEDCRFSDLPAAEVYQKNFLRIYVEALDINPEPFLKQYLIEEKVKKEIKHPSLFSRLKWYNNLPSILRLSIGLSFLFFIIFYLGFQVKRIVEPPMLSLFSPQEGYISKSSTLVVQGETEKEARVYLNGKEIKNSEQGQFKEQVDLNPGINTINIMIKKKHGKTTTEIRHVIFKENKLSLLGKEKNVLD